MSGLLKKIVVTLLLFPALIFLTKVGVADFLRLSPCAYIDSVMKGGVRLDPNELDKARERLLLARSWDSSNPIIPEYLGQTDFMLAQLSGFSPAMQVVFLRKAAANFQSAIALRPNSAHLWASRMTTGSWLLEIDAQLGLDEATVKRELAVIRTAMHRIAVLGPWEPAVLIQLARVGTLRYKALPPDERAIIDAAVLRMKQLNLKI